MKLRTHRLLRFADCFVSIQQIQMQPQIQRQLQLQIQIQIQSVCVCVAKRCALFSKCQRPQHLLVVAGLVFFPEVASSAAFSMKKGREKDKKKEEGGRREGWRCVPENPLSGCYCPRSLTTRSQPHSIYDHFVWVISFCVCAVLTDAQRQDTIDLVLIHIPILNLMHMPRDSCTVFTFSCAVERPKGLLGASANDSIQLFFESIRVQNNIEKM